MMSLSVKLTILSLLLFAVACHNPAADTSRAVTSAPAAPASPQTASGKKYLITPQNSKVEFIGSKVTGSHNGSFQKFSGEIDHIGDDPTKGHVRIDIDMSSVTTEDPKLTNHLKTPDFFDVAKFPQARFNSTRVERTQAADRLKVTGDLTIRNVTRPLTLEVTILKSGKNPRTDVATVGFNATGKLKRSDFGLGAFVPQVGDEITLQVTCQGAEAMGYAAHLKAKEQRDKAKKQ